MLCRHGHQMEILPAQGRKKIISLTRTKYRLKFTCEERIEFEGTRFKIPSLGEENEILLHWTGHQFILEVLGDSPISLNNTLVWKAVLQNCDSLIIGFTQIRFFNHTKGYEEKKVDYDEFSLMNQSSLPILIEGETGVGKTSLARKFHEDSGRGQFVHINLSALSPGLIESELFGHKKGAFTGAINEKEGAFKRADKGTLFLDEIDSLPLELQVKLLTFLDNKEFLPVGSVLPLQTNCKIIFASGKNLAMQVQAGYCRADFYYRLASGFKIVLPPLRSNKNMIRNMIKSFEKKEGRVLEAKLSQFYQDYGWPGNHRQLQMHLYKKLVFAKGGVIRLDSLDKDLLKLNHHSYQQVLPSLEEQKAAYIKYCYHLLNRDVQQTANTLQVNRKTIDKYLKEISQLKSSGYGWTAHDRRSLAL